MSRKKTENPDETTTLSEDTLEKVSGGSNRAEREYGGGSSRGRRTFSGVAIDMSVEKSSPLLQESSLQGDQLAEVDLNMYGNSNQRKKKR